MWSLGVTLAVRALGAPLWASAVSGDDGYRLWRSAWLALDSDVQQGVKGEQERVVQLGALLLRLAGKEEGPQAECDSGVRGARADDWLLAVDLLVRMLAPDPRQRMSMHEVTQHRWLTTSCDVQLVAANGRLLCQPAAPPPTDGSVPALAPSAPAPVEPTGRGYKSLGRCGGHLREYSSGVCASARAAVAWLSRASSVLLSGRPPHSPGALSTLGFACGMF